MDVHNKQTRSYNMRSIHSKDTKPEMLVRKFLHSKGFRYRLYEKDLSGKPDIVLPKYKTLIFVNGCFWHGHEGCKYYVIPKTRTDWWTKKIEANRERDKKVISESEKKGWKTIVVWSCELKSNTREFTLNKIIEILISK